MQKLLSAILFLAFSISNAMAYRIEVEPRNFELNSGDGYHRYLEIIYVPEEGEDQSRIPKEIRMQTRATGIDAPFLRIGNSDTIVKLPEADELMEEQRLNPGLSMSADTEALVASGLILGILPIPVNFTSRFTLEGTNQNLEDFDEPSGEFIQGRAQISLIGLDQLEVIDPTDDDRNSFKDLKLGTLETSTLVCPALNINSEDSSKYSLVDIPQPRVHMEATIPILDGQITDSVTQALVKEDIENTSFSIKSKSKLKRFLSNLNTKKFTLSDVNVNLLDSSDETAKRFSIDGIINEAENLNFRERGLRSLVSKEQARMALSGEDLNAEDLDTNKSKKVKVKFQAKTMGKEKGLFHKAKGDMDVIFSFDSFLPLE